MQNYNQAIIDEFRANAGKVGGRFEGRTLLLLHSKGARTGEERVNPLAYTKDGDRFIVVASKGGAPENPDWYYNLIANPEATVELGTQTLRVRASIPDRAERDRLFEQMAAEMPGFADYQRNTKRVIPVVVLEPIGE
jgi:deazaflavin-dependent oxidoreductase (nitroreductase family)